MIKVNRIAWVCPYCYSAHLDTYIRCLGCNTKRSTRYEVDNATLWTHPNVTGENDTRGIWYAKHTKRGESC